MMVGICTMRLFIYEVQSLKEKRHVVKSVIERVKSRFNASIAEVGDMDKWQSSEIGFSCVSNSRRHLDEMLNNIIHFIERDGRFEVSHIEMEIL
ncbi:DUF503 domain-containing protein [Alkaliphilus hydrothermalis]|uniref:Uncharacterized protein YlxP (DUF503 family) n=1 Tax=Alkaliphilus hydrothermalis TaxID=1482730 RepID=A0ABS2NN92_9FIRM|nr:DUF503 domain-containing protein [Alkaliphilus hydrothermalis]MBM7614423.1 uncharacterized protein YlxP (DUF503 family) [Alkaliphilus hydrothermalis]